MPSSLASKRSRVPDPPCGFCHGVQAPRIRLDQENGPESLTICHPCLRSTTLMKAALNEQRGVRLLREDAEEYGLHLWRSDNAAYLLPEAHPFVRLPGHVRVRKASSPART